MISDQTKKDIKDKLALYRQNWEKLQNNFPIATPEERDNLYMECYRSYSSLKRSIENLKMDKWMDKLNTIKPGKKTIFYCLTPKPKKPPTKKWKPI